MRSFFKIFFAALIAFVVGSVVVFFLFTASITAYFAKFGEEEATEVAAKSVLHLNLNYQMSDRTEKFPSSEFDFLSMQFDDKLGLNDVLKMIRNAGKDNRIEGILLELDFDGPSLAQIEEIRDELVEFKKTGKFVISYGEIVGQKMYYLGSVSDEVYVNPAGVFVFKGLASQSLFFKNALEKLGVDLQIFYAGKYKSATEPFRLTQMSEANREQVESYLNSMYIHLLNNIGGSRNLSPELLDSLANNLVVVDPQSAFEQKLIDGLKYEDEVYDVVRERLGISKKVATSDKNNKEEEEEEEEEDENLNLIKLTKYAKADFSDIKDEEQDYKNKIALVFAEGDIVDGKGDKGRIGSEEYAKEIRKLRKDNSVKAIVLRVNSPGGSAIASDVIWREIVLAKEVKPVIVSMGSLAASGGYFISAPADVIVAQPNTITGSIGVFGIMPNVQELFNDKLGITTDVVKTGKFADQPNFFRPLGPEEEQILQNQINRIYSDFIIKVGAGRNMDTSRVTEIAQGRVYTGLQAKEIGLVDEIGGMDKAIAIAAEKAGLKSWYIREYPKQEDLLERIFGMLNEDVEARYLKAKLGEYYAVFSQLERMMQGHNIQMRMPVDVVVK